MKSGERGHKKFLIYLSHFRYKVIKIAVEMMGLEPRTSYKLCNKLSTDDLIPDSAMLTWAKGSYKGTYKENVLE